MSIQRPTFGLIREHEIAALAMSIPDWAERIEHHRVRRLADSILLLGRQLHPIYVTAAGVVVAGRDRVAARFLLGDDKVWCNECDGSPKALALIELTENLARRPGSDRTQEYRALIDEFQAEALESEPETGPLDGEKPNDIPRATLSPAAGIGGKSFPKTERGKAREKAAKIVGADPRTVARGDQRAAKKEKRKDAPSDAPDLTVPLLEGVIELNGIVIAPHLATAIKILHENLRAMEVGTTALLSRLTSMTKAVAGQKAEKRNWDQFGTLRAAIKEAAGQVRHLIPAQACPYPKAGKDHEDCPACKGTMYLTAAQGTNVPREIAPAKAKPKAGPTVSKLTGKKLQITDDDGKDLPF